jgi:glycosyltransferase involved in cell wall biosynthesis
MLPLKSEGLLKRLILTLNFATSALFAVPFLVKIDAVWASSWGPGYIISKIKQKQLALNVDDLTLEDAVDLGALKEKAFYTRIGESIFRLFYTKADIITPISPGYFDIISKKYCVKPERIKLVRGGVDLSIFKKTNCKDKKIGEFTVLYSGGFSVAYDFNQVFEAAKIMEHLDNEVKFVIQGTGELLPAMLKTIKLLNLQNVEIRNSILSRKDVAELLSKADILLLPLFPFDKTKGRKYAGISSKLYEYQATGKPIICCSNGVPSDYIKSTNSGLTIDSGDPEGLVRAILKIKGNCKLARELGENGRKFVENEASVRVIGLKMELIFQEIDK